MKKKAILLIFILIAFFSSSVFAIEAGDTIRVDTTGKAKKKEKPPVLTPYHKNVIKWNPTPMLLFSEVRNFTFSYERLITKNTSAVIQAGYLLLPQLFADTVGGIIELTGGKKYGVNLSFDYRFYPFQRNRRPAPDGLYLGGYLSYYGFNFENSFNIVGVEVDQNGRMNGKLNIVNLGIELGYQFIFWKRFSLDLLMFGPSLSYYNGDFRISGDLDEDKIKELDQEAVQKIKDRFPLLNSIFSDDDLEFTGTKTNISIGFRYSIQFGFHF